ncbi:hypothetical protein B296_00007172, partial [Ensete ventricosum]
GFPNSSDYKFRGRHIRGRAPSQPRHPAEKRVKAHLRALAYKRAMAKLYNRRVYPRQIKFGDLSYERLRSLTQPMPEAN